MTQGFIENLPPEIIIDTLSRLPVESIVSCKCVCKSWLNLLNTPEFVKSHLSKSSPGLVVFQCEPCNRELITLFKFDDEEQPEHHELHYKPVTKFDLKEFIHRPNSIEIEGSANGLLFLRQLSQKPDVLYVCNPITREYIRFSSPERKEQYYPTVVTYGFGMSKMTGQHKVVRIFHDRLLDPETNKLLSILKSECKVYTLETGSWRGISPGATLHYNCRSNGVFLNGNLHWLVEDLKGSSLISCFDLDTELFTILSLPHPGGQMFLGGLAVLEGCLCLCDNSSDNEIIIWIMKEYGVEKSWSKISVLSKIPNHAGESYESVYPIKIFKDGDILMCWGDFHLLYYCNKTKTTQPTNTFQLQSPGRLDARLHTPTFLSLKSLAKGKVRSF